MKWPNQCRNNEKLTTIHDKSLRVGNQFHLHRIYTIGEKSNFMYKGIVVLTLCQSQWSVEFRRRLRT